jgi:hypothetical protein
VTVRAGFAAVVARPPSSPPSEPESPEPEPEPESPEPPEPESPDPEPPDPEPPDPELESPEPEPSGAPELPSFEPRPPDPDSVTVGSGFRPDSCRPDRSTACAPPSFEGSPRSAARRCERRSRETSERAGLGERVVAAATGRV